MAIDSEDKRRSAVSVTQGLRILPVADSSITQPDWQHTAKVYRGILIFALGTSINPLAATELPEVPPHPMAVSY